MSVQITNITAEEIHDQLLYNFNIKEKVGRIEINLGDISAPYFGKDAIGELLQEWLAKWLSTNNYYFRTRANTQEYPDFLLSDSNSEDFLELKTFNSEAGAAFDIANFDSYCTSLLNTPSRLDGDYLIMSYQMLKSQLKIKNIWLKKVWEISSASGVNPIKIQRKRGMIYNLRPCAWYAQNPQYKPFSNVNEFLIALYETQQNYDQCINYRNNWLDNVKTKYYQETGNKL